MIRAGFLAVALLVASCGRTPDPAETAGARDIDAAARKAVDDTDAAYREASAHPALPIAPEPTPSR